MIQDDTAPKRTHNEDIKDAIPTLAGTIAATLADDATDHFSEDDNQFLKFHGSYQQDDRDLRKTGKKYIMMIRGRIPGGVMTASQWSVFDDLATQHGNNTLRITTRQSIQFHGVVKSGLRPLIKTINDSLLSTLAACGDVNRNVLAPPTPAYTKAREDRLPGLPQGRAGTRPADQGLSLHLDRRRATGHSRPRRTRTSWIRSTARPICRANSRSPSSFRRSTTWTSSPTASASSPSSRTINSSATTSPSAAAWAAATATRRPTRASPTSSASSRPTRSWTSRRRC